MTTSESRGERPTLMLIALLLVVCANAGAGCNSGTRDPAGVGGMGGTGGAAGSGGTGNQSACPAALNGSCRRDTGGDCDEYAGLPATQVSVIASTCVDEDVGMWTAGSACNRSGAVGGCRIVDGAMCVVNWKYDGTAADRMTECADDGGSWVSP